MDFELVFWCVLCVVGFIGFFWFLHRADCDDPVPERTMKRIRGEWYK